MKVITPENLSCQQNNLGRSLATKPIKLGITFITETMIIKSFTLRNRLISLSILKSLSIFLILR